MLSVKDWRLLFRQFATIRKCEGYSVPVLDARDKTFGFDGKTLKEAVRKAFGQLQPHSK